MLVALAASAALCLTAAPASAATVTLGRIAPMGVPGGCGGCSLFQYQSDPASASYVVPPGGPWTVTSWSARGGPTMADAARLLVFRPTAVPNQFQLVANSLDAPIGVVEAPVTDHAAASALGKAVAAGLRAEGASAILARARQALAALGQDAPES